MSNWCADTPLLELSFPSAFVVVIAEQVSADGAVSLEFSDAAYATPRKRTGLLTVEVRFVEECAYMLKVFEQLVVCLFTGLGPELGQLDFKPAAVSPLFEHVAENFVYLPDRLAVAEGAFPWKCHVSMPRRAFSRVADMPKKRVVVGLGPCPRQVREVRNR